ncbi:hypothetical protein BSZ19_18490 [Bradyrhizobium japonicum]|uniref:Uncharacterized protein n=1 Tax=Bradyrhizobium japonicum TaxID=375 RepID=A0A1Y2JNU7_BRAJP|nr:hypothetical protein [Bradyrhizobium japonicum]OSJ32542.1 hypothetical protein BSZ19_18490 [Bradyrhizobium japonicum]
MQPILDQIEQGVRPVLRKYLAAERVLTDAQLANDAAAAAIARQGVLLAARQAVDLLHHLADFVWKEPSAWPEPFTGLDDVRAKVEAHCIFLRKPGPSKDVTLLRDVAVAFKHHRPTRGSVTVSTDIVPAGSGFGMLRFGEGKYGGVEQVIVTIDTGERRALSSILQDVFDAWMTYLGQPLPPISQY